MTTIKNEKELKYEWINQVNSDWESFYEENKMKFVLEANQDTYDFLNQLVVESISYSQVEEGPINDSFTMRYFDLGISSLGEEVEITSVEILGQGFSKWKAQAETIFPNPQNREHYYLAHQEDTDFKYWFGRNIDEEYIQKVFQHFGLIDKCERYEKKFLLDESKQKQEEFTTFFVEKEVSEVFYSSHSLVIKTKDGERKEFRLDPTFYINHFN